MIINLVRLHSDLTEGRRTSKTYNMSHMTEKERQKVEALLRRCRKQTSKIEHDQRDWEERNKAMQAEKEHQQKKSGQ